MLLVLLLTSWTYCAHTYWVEMNKAMNNFIWVFQMLQFAAFLFRKKQWSTVSRERCMQNLDLLTSRAVKAAELEKRKMSATLKTWERMHNAKSRSASSSVAPGLHVQPRRTWYTYNHEGLDTCTYNHEGLENVYAKPSACRKQGFLFNLDPFSACS